MLDGEGDDGRWADWLADRLDRAVSGMCAVEDASDAARITPEFYVDLQRACAGARSDAPGQGKEEGRAPATPLTANALLSAHGKVRRDIEDRESLFRETVMWYREAGVIGERPRAAVVHMLGAGLGWGDMLALAGLKLKHSDKLVAALKRFAEGRYYSEAMAANFLSAYATWAASHSAGATAASPAVRTCRRSACGWNSVTTLPWVKMRIPSPTPKLVYDDKAAADEASLAAAEGFRDAADHMLEAGLSMRSITDIAGYTDLKRTRMALEILYSKLKSGDAEALARMPGFHAAYEEWRSMAEDGGRHWAAGREDTIYVEAVLNIAPFSPASTELMECMADTDYLLDNGMSYGDISVLLGKARAYGRRSVASFLARAFTAESQEQARALNAEAARARQRCARAGQRAAVEDAEEVARKRIAVSEKEGLRALLCLLVSSPDYGHVWLPAFLAAAHVVGVTGTSISRLAGYTIAFSGRFIRRFKNELLRNPDLHAQQATKLKETLARCLCGGADDIQLARYIGQSELRRGLGVAAKSKAQEECAAAAADEDEGRRLICATEEFRRNSIELAIARMDPARWFRATIGALLEEGVSAQEIARMAGCEPGIPPIDLAWLRGGGDAQRLEAMWKSLMERGLDKSRRAKERVRSVCCGESMSREALVAEEAECLRGLMRGLREAPEMAFAWVPYEIGRLVDGGFSNSAIANMAGSESAYPKRSLCYLLFHVRMGHYRAGVRVFRESLRALEGGAASQ